MGQNQRGDHSGFTGPLQLLDSFPILTFNADLAAFKAAATAWQNAGQDLKLRREQRNDLQDVVLPILRDYRQAVLGTFDPEHALVDSLPRLYPAAGSTPDAVTASGGWDEAMSQAQLSWSESDDSNLSGYSIRFCPGPTYSTGDESVIDNVSPGEPREFTTNAGLFMPGSTASFKIYVVLTTGNEKGSNVVSIARPEME